MDEKTIIGIAGALLGAVTTYLVAVLKLRRELEYKYDTESPRQTYSAVSGAVEAPRRFGEICQAEATHLRRPVQAHRVFKAVVFRAGGLFLSEKSRDSYFALQDAIKKLLDVEGQSGEAKVEGEIYKDLSKSGSDLRTALTRDVSTRKSPKLN